METKHTEEDIKEKVILPFLLSLGFDKDELAFEQSFHLKLGRYTVRVDTKEQIKSSQPRLDILVKVDGANLFVIEAKSDKNKILSGDIDQAISYARLVHPIAPFSIVSNGVEFKIYDTISKKELSKATRFREYKLEGNLDAIYDEAFQYFISYSSDNLKLFCKKQIYEGSKTLRGSSQEKTKKFIPDLFTGRQGLSDSFARFMASEKNVFAIVGESGSGKTCEMCGLAFSYMESFPVLFYRGTEIVEGITRAIATDFNWEFSSTFDDISVIKKLARTIKGTVLVFIDGIDEWRYPSKIADIGNFASNVRNYKIKIVLSCKKYPWDSFILQRGVPTALSESVYEENCKKFYYLEEFSNQEFFSILDNYKRFYNFIGLIEDSVLKECKRSPFTLRIFLETADSSGVKHLTFTNREFYERYLEYILQGFDKSEQEKAMSQLRAIAESLCNSGTDSIDMDTLRKGLGLKITENLMPQLFEFNILDGVSDSGETFVSFYFQKLRDYIVAFHVKKWQKSSDANIINDVFEAGSNPVLYEAVKVFYSLMPVDNQRIIDNQLRQNAEKYLKLYNEVMETHFYNVKYKFYPYTRNKVGFIAEYDIKRNMLGMYGFRQIATADEVIKFIPVDFHFGSTDSNISYLFGAEGMHCTSSSDGFREMSVPYEVITNEIIPQIQKLVEGCNLYEGECFYLSLEKVLGSLDKLGFFKEKHRFGVCHYLPLDYEEIAKRIRYKHAYRYLENELVKQRRRDGVIKEEWRGSVVSYHVTFSEEDRKYLHQKSLELVSSKDIEITYRPDVTLNRLEGLLKEGLAVVMKELNSIDTTILPDPDFDVSCRYGGYEKNNFMNIIQRFYKIYLDEYEQLIGSNFPSMCNKFKLYSNLPILALIGVEYDDGNPRLFIHHCNSQEITENTVLVDDSINMSRESSVPIVNYNGKQHKYVLCSNTSFESLVYGMNSTFDSPFSALRSLVYRTIKYELSSVLNELKSMYVLNKV